MLQFGTGPYYNYAISIIFPTSFTNTWYAVTAASMWMTDDQSGVAIGELYEFRTVGGTLFRSWNSGGPNIRYIAIGY